MRQNTNYLLVGLFFLIAQITFGQLTISGKIQDVDTKEGIPYASIYLQSNEDIGEMTDFDGYYTLTIDNPIEGDSLIGSFVGYDDVFKAINIPSDSDSLTINFSLGEGVVELVQLVVNPGENPSRRIVKGIIAKKDISCVERSQNYEVEEYRKVELDLDNITEKMRNKKVFKPFQFVFENIDSLSDEKPFLPVYMMEEVVEVYNEEGKRGKEIIQGRQISGIENQSVADFINRMHVDYNIYDNWITVLDKKMASPFSDLGLHYYYYYLEDSTDIEGQWSYLVSFQPKRKQENTFNGTFWVSDTSFQVQSVNMRLSKDVNINFIDRILISESYKYSADDSLWLPNKSNMVIDFKATDKAPGIIGRKNRMYKDFAFQSKEELNYSQIDEEEQDPGTWEKDDAFWEASRHEKLSKNEALVFTMVDSIKNVPAFKTYADIIYLIVTGHKELGMVEVGPIFQAYSNNPVEGHRFKMGLRTTAKHSKIYRFGGHLAYGLKDEKFKFGVNGIVNLNTKLKSQLSANYTDDVVFSSRNSEDYASGGNLLSGVYRKDIPIKLLHVKEAKVSYYKRHKRGFSNKLTVLNQRLDPYSGIDKIGDGFNFAYNRPSDNVLDTTLVSTEVILNTRYAFKENKLEGPFQTTSSSSKYPIINLQVSQGIKGIFDSQYDYTKLIVGYKHWFHTSPLGWFGYDIKAGKTFGELPLLLLESHSGNETFFFSKHAFNGMNQFEFISDQYVSVSLEQHFDGFFLNKVPLFKKLNLRSVATFKAVMGDMTDKNYELNKMNAFDESKVSDTTWSGFRVPNKKPYMEVGVGVENILKVLRFDAIWRLTYLDTEEASPLNLRFGVDFAF